MPKFFVDAADIRGDLVLFSGANADHLRVLRIRPGETLTVTDGAGLDYTCLAEGPSQARIVSSYPCESEASVKALVLAALPKGDKAETIIQKAVELGAAEIGFFAASRCVARLDEKSAKAKLTRWNKVAEEAAMQSYRGKLPPVRWLGSFAAMLEWAKTASLGVFLWEEARQLSLRGALEAAGDLRSAALITGPEGGFSQAEADQAAAAGLLPVTLGRRILRCETAPLAALSALMYHTNNLN